MGVWHPDNVVLRQTAAADLATDEPETEGSDGAEDQETEDGSAD